MNYTSTNKKDRLPSWEWLLSSRKFFLTEAGLAKSFGSATLNTIRLGILEKRFDMRKLPTCLVIVLGLWVVNSAVQADIYKFVDRSGQVFYTDEPKNSQYKLVIKSIIRSQKKRSGQKISSSMRKNKDRFSPIITTAAKKYSVDPHLLHAVIRAESAYNPKAVSHKGAVGLMQLMPATAKRYGVNDRENPRQNINGGAKYLRDLLKMFESNISLAVAAYNAGENNVIKYGNQIPPFRETKQYVSRVLKYYHNKNSS